jgi:glycosyltransferase involved in cell wall biosynthesis
MEEAPRKSDIVCLSHLKWERTLFQRPQQVMTQLSARHRVLFVGQMGTREFLSEFLRGRWGRLAGRVHPRLGFFHVPYLPFTRHWRTLNGLRRWLVVALARLAAGLLGFRNVWLWLYDPALWPFCAKMPRSRLVYDCMDHFDAFDDADPLNAVHERDLIRQADCVFTGGRTLQKAKEGLNPRTHCFPSGIDRDHFSRARDPQTPLPPDIASLPHPILGYFGALDERLDCDLLRALCRRWPGGSVVLLGPLVRPGLPLPTDEPNFHPLGKKPYETLPNYLKAFDVCLMPFVDSDLTRHISPTKTPEYLAGGKPVVSTPIPDVVADYGESVRFGPFGDSATFCDQVEAALSTPPTDSAPPMPARSWQEIAQTMERLLNA